MLIFYLSLPHLLNQDHHRKGLVYALIKASEMVIKPKPREDSLTGLQPLGSKCESKSLYVERGNLG